MCAPITATWILPFFLSLFALFSTVFGAPAPAILPNEVDAKANANATAVATNELESRQYYSEQRLTYYEPGLGACGWESTADQWVSVIFGFWILDLGVASWHRRCLVSVVFGDSDADGVFCDIFRLWH